MYPECNNSFGSDAIGRFCGGMNYEFFAYFVVNAFAQATVTFTSQNFGAGEPKRCRKIFHTAMVLSLVCCGLLSLVFVLWRNFFLQIYTTDPAVLLYAKQRIVIATTLECLTSVYEISCGSNERAWTFFDACVNYIFRFLRAAAEFGLRQRVRWIHDFGFFLLFTQFRGLLQD